jgi:ferritin-like metal-binding protein YciE
MGLFTSKEFNSLDDLFFDQIGDLYDAEKRLTEALPKMVEAASDAELKDAFQHHLEETKKQVKRLENVFKQLGREPERETCDAMKGLLSEGEEIIGAKGDPAVLDAALIAAAQRVEHYEMAGYGTAREFADRLGHMEAVKLLQETLDEEKKADKKLTEIAARGINAKASY